MVKIFIGNLSQETTAGELRSLFSQYGKISECDIVKNYGFVHMEDKEEASEAIRKLRHHELNGQAINVEMSRGNPKGSTKLHVSNINNDCTNQELRAKFEEFGPVVECDIVKDYAFVHMELLEDAMEAVSGLDNTAFQGKLMNVQLSTSRLRTAPGMGDQTGCYVCGKQGHWSKDCQRGGQNGSYGEGPGVGFMGGFRGGRGFPRGAPGFGRGGPGFDGRSFPGGPPPPPPPMGRRPGYGAPREYGDLRERYGGRPSGAYPERSPAYARDRYGSVDFYEKFRMRPYGASYPEERRLSIPPPPPPSSSSLSRMRMSSSGLDAYERRLLPPPPPPSSAAAYYARDRSPIRRVGVVSEGYSYERSRLSPVSRSSSYAVSRARDPYTERARYAY